MGQPHLITKLLGVEGAIAEDDLIPSLRISKINIAQKIELFFDLAYPLPQETVI